MTEWAAKACETIREHPAPQRAKRGRPAEKRGVLLVLYEKTVCGIYVVR